MTIRTAFDMYLAPPSEPAFAAMADSMRCAVTALGWSGGLQGDWHVGQVCGITLATQPKARFHYLSTPSLAEDGVPPGHYNSLIITPREGGLAAACDFDPARHRAAINEPGSFSGALTFIEFMRGRTGLDKTGMTCTAPSVRAGISIRLPWLPKERSSLRPSIGQAFVWRRRRSQRRWLR